ncbi:MAG: hypothetical protein KZQ95_14945 [Candidatus Thiodiazotropha sp. (ex Epidulcina cf. delphinae)]|nr:hypothetical protein [Candidatus Thiodiazotropha sp. (ex Epidulcina cf. delphinae)]
MLPSLLILKTEILRLTSRQAIVSRLKLIGISITLAITMILAFGSFRALYVFHLRPLRLQQGEGIADGEYP